MIRILVVEDEQAISNLIAVNLRKAGYACDCVYDGMSAADALEEGAYDWKTGTWYGFDSASWVAASDEIVAFCLDPRNFLNGSSKTPCVTKPFEIIELLARVETVLRRCHKTEQFLTEGDLVIDTASRTVKKNGTMVNLTNKEYELLLLFVRNKNIALYRETIYERIWGGEYTGDSRTVDLHVQRMRRKVGWEDKIVTVYKVGYRLEG